MKRKSVFNSNKMEFSDPEIADQMENQIHEISKKQIKQVDKERMILEIYQEKKKKKKEKEIRKQRQKKQRIKTKPKMPLKDKQFDLEGHMDERQEGEINQHINQQDQNQGIPSINDLVEHIKPITLTRTRLQDLLNSTRFQQLIKGCFVRYHCPNTNNYMIAEILGTADGKKQYKIGKASTNLLIRLQLATNEIKNLSMQIVSNQQPPGALQIKRWFDKNRQNIPKVDQLIQKKKELDKGLTTEISTEQINGHILKNIERVIKKPKNQIKQDVSSYLSFLLQRNHHIDVQIKDHQYQVDSDPEDFRYKRNKQNMEQKKKLPKADLAELYKEKAIIETNISKLREIQREQRERRNQKKQISKPKFEQIQFDTVIREDKIAEILKLRVRGLSQASEYIQIQKQILQDHNNHTLNIQL